MNNKYCINCKYCVKDGYSDFWKCNHEKSKQGVERFSKIDGAKIKPYIHRCIDVKDRCDSEDWFIKKSFINLKDPMFIMPCATFIFLIILKFIGWLFL